MLACCARVQDDSNSQRPRRPAPHAEGARGDGGYVALPELAAHRRSRHDCPGPRHPDSARPPLRRELLLSQGHGGGSAAEARAKIEEAVRTLLESGGRPIVLGGDHSVTYPIVRAVRWFHPRLSILHFDAHPDLYPEFEGDRYSHACPFARILEERLADQVVQVGIRTMNAVQRAQAERYGVEVIDMRAWVEGRRPTLREPVYVSIDLDAFDPAFAPGVSHREPGGLTVREVLTVLQGLSVPLVAADIVEFNPAADPSGMTATLCAKLVKEVAGKMT